MTFTSLFIKYAVPKIRLLSSEVRSKIAAGEVIVRPNSVIKELIENSLDAGSKRIEIEIELGGKKKCLVNDDGIGMSRADALLSIERYATSKIETIDDIEDIKTFGFRGEALASIAQVSFLELETADGNEGTKIFVEGGERKQVVDTFRDRGTRIKVSNLFFNLPARLKFLKSDEYERRLIIEVVKTYALISPQVHFVLTEPNRSILNLPAVENMKMRLMQIYSESAVNKLLSFELDVGAISFRGFLSPLGLNEKINLNLIYVNSRPVRYPRIARIIAEVYQQPKESPQYLLSIKVPGQMLDINIHPTKNEVKIKEERYIMDLLTQGIKKKIFPGTASKDYTSERTGFVDANANIRLVQDFVIPYTDTTPRSDGRGQDTIEFWQLHSTYIFAQTSTGLIIVDQHVAHERIIYEAILGNKGSAQHLLFPLTLELTPEEYRIYQRTKDTLKSIGIEFKEFSSRTLVLDTIPADSKLTREDLQGFFGEIGSLGTLMNERKELAKVVACRMAIKAGQKLSAYEMQSLIDQLFACENPFICPHGRPIVIKVSLDDLDKRFGR